MLYGPFRIGNKHVSQRNDLFDSSLKMQNKFLGLEILEMLVKKLTNMVSIKKNLFACQPITFF